MLFVTDQERQALNWIQYSLLFLFFFLFFPFFIHIVEGKLST